MRYRLYYNRSEDAPWVWSFDEGTQATERLLKDYRLHGVDAWAGTDFAVRVGDANAPRVWVNVEAKDVRIEDGIGHFYGRWTDSGYPLRNQEA